VRSALLLQILAIPVGFMLARLHWHRLRDAAGFSGGILVPISGLAIAVTVAAGSWAAVQLAGVAPRSALLVALSSVIIAYGVALHDYLAD
jgi:hydrogenase/urease accessory protein HupE